MENEQNIIDNRETDTNEDGNDDGKKTEEKVFTGPQDEQMPVPGQEEADGVEMKVEEAQEQNDPWALLRQLRKAEKRAIKRRTALNNPTSKRNAIALDYEQINVILGAEQNKEGGSDFVQQISPRANGNNSNHESHDNNGTAPKEELGTRARTWTRGTRALKEQQQQQPQQPQPRQQQQQQQPTVQKQHPEGTAPAVPSQASPPQPRRPRMATQGSGHRIAAGKEGAPPSAPSASSPSDDSGEKKIQKIGPYVCSPSLSTLTMRSDQPQ